MRKMLEGGGDYVKLGRGIAILSSFGSEKRGGKKK